LQHQFPSIGEAEIKDGVGHRFGLAGTYRTDRLKFDLDLSQVGDRRIGSVERAIG
jgi:hypothetical protein